MKRWAAAGLALGAALLLGAQDPKRAPELEGGKEWFNTDKALSLAQLKGKVVLLDFWTYC